MSEELCVILSAQSNTGAYAHSCRLTVKKTRRQKQVHILCSLLSAINLCMGFLQHMFSVCMCSRAVRYAIYIV